MRTRTTRLLAILAVATLAGGCSMDDDAATSELSAR